ncbi:unnamed protein product [Closterium sp. NIES-54]
MFQRRPWGCRRAHGRRGFAAAARTSLAVSARFELQVIIKPNVTCIHTHFIFTPSLASSHAHLSRPPLPPVAAVPLAVREACCTYFCPCVILGRNVNIVTDGFTGEFCAALPAAYRAHARILGSSPFRTLAFRRLSLLFVPLLCCCALFAVFAWHH